MSRIFVLLTVVLVSVNAVKSQAQIYKINNSDNLDLTTSWSTTSGSQSPNPGSIGSTDAAYFNEVTMLGSKTVSLGSDLALGGLALDYVTSNTANNLTINAGNTLTLNGTTLNGNGAAGSGTAYSNTGILLNRGTGGAMIINSDVAIGADQTWVSSRSLTVNGGIAIGTRTLSLNVAGGTTLLSGPISGSGTITKTGGSFFNLLGDGTSFTGAITNTSAQALAIGLNTAQNASSVTSSGTGYLAMFYAGTTFIKNINVSSNNGFRADYGEAGTKIAEINQTADGAITSQIVQGSRVIGITKTGPATLTISSPSNTASGVYNVNGGTLKLGSAVALGTTANGTTVASGAVLDLNGQAIGAEALTLNGTGIASGGALVNSNSATPASLSGAVSLATASSVGGAGDITLSGGVSGASASLTKVGTGTLTLSGTNTYAGTTTVSAGTLVLGSSATLSSSVFDVGSGGTLDVSALSSGLALGSGQFGGRGTLVGDVSFGSSSQLAFDVAGPLVVSSGTLTFDPGFGIANLVGVNWDSLAIATPYTVVSTSQVFSSSDIGNFGFANRVSVGSTGREAYFQTGSLELVVVPEPGTLGLAAAALGLAAWQLGRRRS